VHLDGNRREGAATLGVTLLATLYALLILGRYVDVVAPSLLGRAISLYWDVPQLPQIPVGDGHRFAGVGGRARLARGRAALRCRDRRAAIRDARHRRTAAAMVPLAAPVGCCARR
jgi:hypothetical protein